MLRDWKISVEESRGNWRCRWRGKYGTGQQTFIYKADAQEHRLNKRREFERADSDLAPLPKLRQGIMLGKYAEEYLAYSQKEKSFRTWRNFDKPVVASLRKFFGDHLLIGSIEPAGIQRWKHGLAEGTTAAILFRQARAFFNYAVRMRYLPENPAKGIKKPAEGIGGRALKDDELKKLLAAAPDELRRAAIFSMNTMLRIGEVTIFDWAWVEDLPGGAWLGRVPWNLRKTRGKVRKDCIFPINAAAKAMMGERQASGLVFPWKPELIQHQITAIRRALKLPEDITFHCFRHTGATRYLKNGHMEDLLDTRLWSDPRSLLRYIHVEPATLVPRFAALGENFGPTWPLHAKEKRPHF